MRNAKVLMAWIFCILSVSLVRPSCASDEYILADGSRAVIGEGQLLVTQRDSRRAVARPGTYETSDGRYTIIVKPKGIEVRDNLKEPR